MNRFELYSISKDISPRLGDPESHTFIRQTSS